MACMFAVPEFVPQITPDHTVAAMAFNYEAVWDFPGMGEVLLTLSHKSLDAACPSHHQR